MEERRKIAKGLVTAHIIAFILSLGIGLLTNIVIGMISFALLLPPAAYLSPKIIDKLPADR